MVISSSSVLFSSVQCDNRQLIGDESQLLLLLVASRQLQRAVDELNEHRTMELNCELERNWVAIANYLLLNATVHAKRATELN
jgi:hypothetical protein